MGVLHPVSSPGPPPAFAIMVNDLAGIPKPFLHWASLVNVFRAFSRSISFVLFPISLRLSPFFPGVESFIPLVVG